MKKEEMKKLTEAEKVEKIEALIEKAKKDKVPYAKDMFYDFFIVEDDEVKDND